MTRVRQDTREAPLEGLSAVDTYFNREVSLDITEEDEDGAE